MNVYISSHLGKGCFICFLYSFVSECLLFQGLYLQLFIEPFCMNCLSLLRKKKPTHLSLWIDQNQFSQGY